MTPGSGQNALFVSTVASAVASTLGNALQALTQQQSLPPGLARQLSGAAPSMQPGPANVAAMTQGAISAAAAQAQPAQSGTPAAPTGYGLQAAPASVVQQPAGLMAPQAPLQAAARPDAVAVPLQAAQANVAASPAQAHPMLAPQARPDAVPLAMRADGAVVERAPSSMPGAPSATTPAGSTAAAAGTTAATAAPAGATQATVATVLASAVPASQSPGDAKGATMLAAGDRAQAARADGTVAHGHTVAGTQQRRAWKSLYGVSALLAALGSREHAERSRREAEFAEQRLVERVFQWLYWVLAIVAYGCLALSILVFLPVLDGNVAPAPQTPVWVGGFAMLGLAAGIGAWLLARRLK
ncbi:hypothetical protein [Luteimonas suaedae]|uniref:hypothetical protein n=1 Tax=Luteimonas suaedae TaxID=2605430 RepID=UPI0011EEE4EC|nr:hypothetical protein [Luteimonas suaedae]